MNDITLEKKITAWLIPLLVALFTLTIFLPALKDGILSWDDASNLVDNKKYRGLGWEQLKWIFSFQSSFMGPYAPLTWLTYALDYVVWGMNPFGYHLTNVVLHTINALTFYFLCLKLLALAIPPSVQEKKEELYISAGFAALFFSIHPLRVESVSWLSDRHDMLSCLFYMLAILCYITPRSAGGERTPFWRRYVLPLMVFFFALMSKGMAISFPLVLILLDIYPLRRIPGDPKKWFSRETSRIWLEKIPFFLLSAAFGAIGLLSLGKIGSLSAYQKSSFGARAAQVLYAVSLYLRNTFLPSGLSPFYRLPPDFGLLNWQSFLSGSAIAAITAAAIALRRRWPAGLAVWAYYLATLSPVAGFVKINVQSAADRYTYLPCLGFAVLAGAGLRAGRQTAEKRLRNIYAVLACSLLIVLAALTWRQEAVWRDSEALYRRVLALNPELEFAHFNFAFLLAEQGKTDEAVSHYREALRVKPDYETAHYNLGIVLAGQGKTDEAIEHYREAIRLKPDYAQAHTRLGIVLASQGKTEEAVKHYREAIRVNPDYAQARNNLGLILASQGKLDEAAANYLEALTINPDYAQAHNNLGLILAARGKLDEAGGHYREALRIEPDSVEAHYNLSLVLAAQGKMQEALKQYREALRLNPKLTAPPPREQ